MASSKEPAKVAKSAPTTWRSRSIQPTEETIPAVPVHLLDSIAKSVREELHAAINSDSFCAKLMSKLVPAITEAVKKKVSDELHDAFHLELDNKQKQLDKLREEPNVLKR
ncbi:hypothetical protein HOLleu_39265 [Holothuria leucospilota]|uniref:Uncharacterized protein n=1 Tax=Holothuria leucospilota TaxID=206669 RepID=A0A9Q0YKK8_HOLLE|nr:hypothetical protein HOLleu_39265 [Holothuria leucospilota]